LGVVGALPFILGLHLGLTDAIFESVSGFTTTGLVSMTKTAGTATLQGNVNAGALTINGSGGTLNGGSGAITPGSGYAWGDIVNGGGINIYDPFFVGPLTISTGIGNIVLNGSTAFVGAQGVTWYNATLLTTSGNIYVNGVGHSGGINLPSGRIQTTSGIVALTGSSSDGNGIQFQTAASIISTGTVLVVSFVIYANFNIVHLDLDTYFSDVDEDGLENIVDSDIDGDGVLNSYDSDADGDGAKNIEELPRIAERFRGVWYAPFNGELHEITRRFGTINNSSLSLYVLDEFGMILGPEMEENFETNPDAYTKNPDEPNFGLQTENILTWLRSTDRVVGPKTTPAVGDLVFVRVQEELYIGLAVTEKPTGILYADPDVPVKKPSGLPFYWIHPPRIATRTKTER